MIAIPNMEKPKSCWECPAHTFNYGYIPDYDGCRILKRAFNVDKLNINPFNEVLPDCPLIEIVTCGECKYVGTDATCCLVCCRDGMGLKPYNVYHDDFCSYGERRE